MIFRQTTYRKDEDANVNANRVVLNGGSSAFLRCVKKKARVNTGGWCVSQLTQKRPLDFTADFPSYSLPVLRWTAGTLCCRDAGKQRENANLDGARNFLMVTPLPFLLPPPFVYAPRSTRCGNGCGNFATKCNFSVSSFELLVLPEFCIQNGKIYCDQKSRSSRKNVGIKFARMRL